MFDVHIPTHETYLKAHTCGVESIITQDKLDGITVGVPREALSKAHMMALVNGPVLSETVAEV